MRGKVAPNLCVLILSGLLSPTICLFCSGLLAQAADTPAPQPPGPTLQAKLILKTDTYTLDPAQSGPEFVKKLKESEKDMGKTPPLPPAVEMTLELTNIGKDPVTIPLGGDLTHLEIKLEGPGAVTIGYAKMHTMEFRLGKPTPIEPGKSLAIPITRLLYGQRGDSFACYWTLPGTYTLTTSYTTPLTPSIEEGSPRPLTFAAAPVKVNVLAPEPTRPAAVTRAQALKAAAALLKEKGIAWGQPETVQQMPNGGWSLQYATPEMELAVKGPREVIVSPEGKASLAGRD